MTTTSTKRRMTPQRRRILDELTRRCDHPTADQIYDAVRADLPHISLGTVYRNLDVLVQEGLATRLDAPGGQARFDADTQPHYHVRCRRCGRVDDVVADALEPLLLPHAQCLDYEITGVRVEFEGLCSTCLAD